ncbi:GNAT family N-acetyltransferase [Oricola sp.]|uniref:GNAT family N-acetyltransferase n=1 Tax=Oricola sp. TaxID=1979950 RepID=UPI003BAA1761
MVDIASFTENASGLGLGVNALHCEVLRGREHAMRALAMLQADAVYSGYQHPVFLRSWFLHAPGEPVFVVLRAEGMGPVILPLERIPGSILAYPGGRHANGNFPIGAPRDVAAIAAMGEPAIAGSLRAAGLGASAISLERQLPSLAGVRNPFAFAGSATSPNPALALSLEGGFDEVLKRHSAKRRRKRFRNQERRLAEHGGYRFVGHVGQDDVPAVLDRFFELKARRFEEAGIHDVFAGEQMQGFFCSLFQDGCENEPRSHELKLLEVGGEAIAIIGCTIVDGRITVEFGTFDAQYGEIGPGDMLFFLAIREAAERGLEVFDFGIGDEPYKRGWCEIETLQSDTVIPLGPAGHVFAARKRARSALVRAVKTNKLIWPMVKRLRAIRSPAR